MLVLQNLPDADVETDADRAAKTRTHGLALLRGATLLTVTDRGRVKADLLIRDGKIAQIGENLAAPEGAVSIDATGLYVMPGIVDCHSHMATDGGINEWSQSITCDVRIKDTVDADDVAIYRAAAGGCTTANVLHGSANTIGGQNAVIKCRWGKKDRELLFEGAPQGVKFALGENVKRSNSDKRGDRYPQTRMGVEAVIRQAFAEGRDYLRAWDDFRAERRPEPRRDLRLESIGKILTGEFIIHCHCYRADEILMMMRVCEEFGVKIATFQHVLEGYRVGPEMAKHGVGGSTFSDWWAYKIEAYDATPFNAALMTRAGVCASVNSDSDELGRHLNLEAAKCMKYGDLNETETLALITLNAAKQLRIDARVGSIEEGKDADLAVYRGHPLSAYSRCVMTLIDGEVVFEHRDGGDVAGDFKPARRAPLEVPLNKGGVYVVRHATIYPVTSSPIEDGSIVIADGKILDIGKDVPAPAGATLIDATGLRVYPGMIDAGTHLGLLEIGSVHGTRDTAELGDYQPHLAASAAYNPHSEHVAVSRFVGVTAALSAPQGGVVSGQSALMRLDGWTAAEAAVLDAAALHVEFPRRPNPEEGKKEEEPQGEKDLRKWFEDAVAYGKRADEALKRGLPFERDLRLEATVPYARGEKPIVFEAGSWRTIRAAVKFGRSLNLRTIVGGGREAWKVADLLAAEEVPVIVGPSFELPADRYEPYDSVYSNAARLAKAGVTFCFRTNDSENVRNLPYQASVAAAHGLDRDLALRAVTIEPARILGVDDRLGSLEKGKLADLFVTTGDPLEIVTDVVALFIAGRPVPMESKHTREYEKFKKRLEK